MMNVNLHALFRVRIATGGSATILGACARDAVLPFQRDGDDAQPLDTVLALAVSRASYALVKRLLDEGVDIHTKQQHTHNPMGAGGLGREKASRRDVTALHIASLFWNAEAIKDLLDYQADSSAVGHGIRDLVSSRDSNGRLTLHWAAAGHDTRECGLPTP
ncbi:hypothetical protein Aspvir_004454 [Aspergillus viridinutans]|uniref:Ankyrin n=1 Tax=Aspergillus viridinutans TaxID=75553 RepID=A0A9P3BXM3_ASPVI|nr:uncharacterized protein Aspvir_004454 [Aspergillus viridinutans]GIK00429.1 hypothetical protein Aspvir_004454 [Aspergillus viridinutans]